MEHQKLQTNQNTQMQKPSANGLSLQGKARLFELGGVINKMRVIQGWNILGPTDIAPLAAVWDEQLHRFAVPPALYDDLLNMCIDFRRKRLLSSEHCPALSVELFLAMFEDYRMETMRSISSLENQVNRLERDLEMSEETTKPFDKESHYCRPGSMDHNTCESGHTERQLNFMTRAGVSTLSDLVAKAKAQLDSAQQKLDLKRSESKLFEVA